MYNKLFILIVMFFSFAFSQELPIERTTGSGDMRHSWRADWITHPTASGYEHGVYHFRRNFQLDSIPTDFLIYISADNRYQLFVNGTSVCEGPARYDLHHWPYDTIDIQPYLTTGKNVIAVQVVNFGEYKSGGQFSEQTALIVQSEMLEALDSNADWKVIKNKGMRANPITPESFKEYYQVLGFYAGGPCDSLVATDYPWSWQQVEFDDNDWLTARVIRKGGGRGFAYGHQWFLVPRTIKMLTEKILPITHIVRSKNITLSEPFLSKKEPSLTVPANSHVSILYDNRKLTMGYPLLAFSQGAASTIRLTYAESLYDDEFKKGNRDEIAGKEIYGIFDIIKPDGGDNRLFRPLWVRAFRYLELDISTTDKPLILDNLNYAFTVYPLTEIAKFHSNDPSLTDIWDASWRALQLCGRETFFSDAYFEQMQYIGDTRVQALATLAVSGDASLFKNALQQFDQSRLPNGLTQSRYPARELQIIPTYSLLYIAMIHDYWKYVDDADFVETLLPGIHSILAWFKAHQDKTGLLTNLDWWNYCDWVTEYRVGMPPGADDGYSTLIALQYVYALQKATEIMQYFNKQTFAEQYEKDAQVVRNAVNRLCFVPEKNLYAETPKHEQFSQHSNIFAILTDTHAPEKQTQLAKRIVTNKDLIQTTFYFKFYLFEALQHCKMADEFNQQLDPWRKFINLGLTTFPEDDSDTPRSDCHPWSSSPCFYMLSLIAGIQPVAPGFRSVIIEPSLGPLNALSVSYPHPLGSIDLKLERKGNDGISGTITLPPGLQNAKFKWKDASIQLYSGKQKIRL